MFSKLKNKILRKISKKSNSNKYLKYTNSESVVRLNMSTRPAYAYCLYNAVQLAKKLNYKNIKYIKVSKKGSELSLREILNKITNLGYMRILVEGGSHLSGSLLKKNYVNEIQWFRASKIIGKGGVDAVSDMGVSSMKSTKNFVLLDSKNYGNDILTIYRKG